MSCLRSHYGLRSSGKVPADPSMAGKYLGKEYSYGPFRMTCGNCGRSIQNSYGFCQTTARCKTLYKREYWTRALEIDPGIIERKKQQRHDYYAGEGGSKQRQTLAERRHYWQQRVDRYKVSSGCARCGFRSERAAFFDLDHVDKSAKQFSISSLCARLTPDNSTHAALFAAEMQKCQVLCVACHREKSAREQEVRS